MQKREAGKAPGSATTPAKRGRPFGSTAANIAAASAAAAAAAAEAAAPASLLGPSLQIPASFGDQHNKRIVLALQSGLKSELTWALNTLTVLSFKEKDDLRRDATPLAKIAGLLDAVLQIVDDWRDVALPRDCNKSTKVRSLGANSLVTGFGNEYVATGSSKSLSHSSHGSGSSNTKVSVSKDRHPSDWWFDEDGLFNLDDEGRQEKQQCAVAASNIIRNFSFMPDNEVIMAQHRHCLETVFQCIEDHNTAEDEELITNALETIVNLSPLLDLRIFSSSKPSYIKMTESRAVQSIMGMLGSSVKAWHCAAAELLGRLVINPDNEPFLLPYAPQIYKRLVDLLSVQAVDAHAAAVGALYNLAEVNMDCRLKLASERWAVDRLLKIVRTPHPVLEVCRKAGMILESLVSEPQNKALLAAHESTFAEILLTDGKYSDTFARILYELTSRPNNKAVTGRGVWGM